MPHTIRYPHVKVSLKDLRFGVYDVVSRTAKAMKDAGVPHREIEDYVIRASEHDLARALVVTAETVSFVKT